MASLSSMTRVRHVIVIQGFIEDDVSSVESTTEVRKNDRWEIKYFTNCR